MLEAAKMLKSMWIVLKYQGNASEIKGTENNFSRKGGKTGRKTAESLREARQQLRTYYFNHRKDEVLTENQFEG